MSNRINYVMSIDISKCFDEIPHELLIKAISYRIADKKVIRLLKRLLKSGIVNGEELTNSKQGTPQGGVISPLLANIFLHFAFDIWFIDLCKQLKGTVKFVRYADDIVILTQYKIDTEIIYRELKKHLVKLGMKLNENKSKIIKFTRYESDKFKPENGTFNFLGLTHFIGKSRKGFNRLKRRTDAKTLKEKKRTIKEWLRKISKVEKVSKVCRLLKIKLIGHDRYFGVTDNINKLRNFHEYVKQTLLRSLNRRSQKQSYNWKRFNRLLKYENFPRPRIYVNVIY